MTEVDVMVLATMARSYEAQPSAAVAIVIAIAEQHVATPPCVEGRQRIRFTEGETLDVRVLAMPSSRSPALLAVDAQSYQHGAQRSVVP